MDLQSGARSDCGLRSLVGAVAAGFLFLTGFECACMVDCVLCAGAVLQLSALHGDGLSRLPSFRRFSEVPHLYGPYDGTDCADAAAVAPLAAASALDLHHLSDVEPVALQ